MSQAHLSNVASSPSTLGLAPIRSPREALEQGAAFLTSMQRDGGHWEEEVVWCPMLTAQYVFTAFIIGQEIAQDRIEKFTRYFDVWQLPDGSWGMHAQSSGYLFVTTLVYIAMRMMGHAADDPRLVRARQWIFRCHGRQRPEHRQSRDRSRSTRS